MNTAAIASHLNIAESLIKSVEEWEHVLFVRFIGHRPRFVSKKVVKMAYLYDAQVGAIDLSTARISSAGANSEIIAESSVKKVGLCFSNGWYETPDLEGKKVFIPKPSEFKLDVERTVAKLERMPVSTIVKDVKQRYLKALEVYKLMPHLKPDNFDAIGHCLSKLGAI